MCFNCFFSLPAQEMRADGGGRHCNGAGGARAARAGEEGAGKGVDLVGISIDSDYSIRTAVISEIFENWFGFVVDSISLYTSTKSFRFTILPLGYF